MSEILAPEQVNWGSPEAMSLIARQANEDIEAGIYESYIKSMDRIEGVSPKVQKLFSFIARSEFPLIADQEKCICNDSDEYHRYFLTKTDPRTGDILTLDLVDGVEPDGMDFVASLSEEGTLLGDPDSDEELLNPMFTIEQARLVQKHAKELQSVGLQIKL